MGDILRTTLQIIYLHEINTIPIVGLAKFIIL